MSNVEITRGFAEGWSAYKDPATGQWQWSAYGPNGSSHGVAHSHGAARMRALRAVADLKRPRTTEDGR